jgi:cell division protein FtsA
MMTPPDREQIQAIPREFRIDGQRNIQRPIGMCGGKLEVVTHIICGQTTHLQNTERAVKMTGNRVDQIVVQPLASGLAVLSEEEMELGTAVVDIGGGTSDVAVFSGGAIAFTASVPVGGQHITSDLYKLLKTSPDEAERIKQEFGSARLTLEEQVQTVDVHQLGQTAARPLPRKVIGDIVECRVKEIAKLVRQQIERSGLYGVLPGGVVLTGGGSQLPGISEVFGNVLGYQRMRIGYPRAVGSYARVASLPSMATAVGLAGYALQEADEFAPASGGESWRERIRSLKTLFART